MLRLIRTLTSFVYLYIHAHTTSNMHDVLMRLLMECFNYVRASERYLEIDTFPFVHFACIAFWGVRLVRIVGKNH